MAKSLIIVESPAKARTIKKYLGPNYAVKASVGHVKDLPQRRLGIDIANNFAPEYVTIKGKNKILQELRAEAKKADRVFLAPDPDREGEAIAWHIANELQHVPRDQIYRILLHEITQRGITEALQHPGRIDEDKVSAQQARRLLDRLVGYKISPLLWKKVQRGLSAGRVQSVALRIVCEREQAIEAFKPQEYWTIDADMTAAEPPPFRARLQTIKGKKAKVSVAADAQRIVADLQGATYQVSQVKKTTRRRHPAPPFTTSTLQQEAARKLRFSAQRTMRVAQQLYEGLALGDAGEVGLITYMRTDSTRVADDAVQEAREYIETRYGKDYVALQQRKYKKQKAAQEAHEAIRPTSVRFVPNDLHSYLSREQLALYTLVWNRFVASQMSSAVLDHTRVDVTAKHYLFRATGAVMRFPGFTSLYEESAPETSDNDADRQAGDNRTLPRLEVGQPVQVTALTPNQHFTQPPPRFTEASLVSEMEKLGIGRPSTYASILSTLRERNYVGAQDRKLVPTEVGKIVNTLLIECFPDLLDVQFTAQLEDKLDKIEEGQYQWVETLQNFYTPFAAELDKAMHQMRDVKKEVEETDEICDQCQRPMVIRWGRFGRFLACSGYPDCKNTRELATEGATGQPTPPAVEATCERCGRPMVVKRGRYGEFLACTGYPDCKTTRPASVVMECPEAGCKGHIVPRKTRRGRTFYGCTNYPQCTFSAWQRPVPKACPHCQSPYLLEKRVSKKGNGHVLLQCPTQTCDYSETAEATSVA
jgi:DNA topoisomerase-1